MMARSDQQFYKVAFHDSPRQEAMDKEDKSLQNNETLDHVSLSPKRRDKISFIYGKLEEYICMEQPKRYTDDSSLVCKLRKPLYGLKQAPRIWHLKLNSSILSHWFKTCKSSCKSNNISSHI